MNHILDIEIACKHGVDIALFLNNIAFWIQKNAANEQNIHEGRVWTFNTIKSFSTIFPYWTFKQIRRIIDECIEKELIVTGNFNKKSYDRTHWYSLTDKALIDFPLVSKAVHAALGLKCPNGQMQVPKWANASAQMGTPIPDNKTQIINTDIRDIAPEQNMNTSEPLKLSNSTPKLKPIEYEETYYEQKIDVQDYDQEESDRTFEEFWSLYPIKKAKLRAKCMWYSQKCYKKANEILIKLRDQLVHDTQFKQGFVVYPAKYITEERWNDEIVMVRDKKQTNGVKLSLDFKDKSWADDLDLSMCFK